MRERRSRVIDFVERIEIECLADLDRRSKRACPRNAIIRRDRFGILLAAFIGACESGERELMVRLHVESHLHVKHADAHGAFRDERFTQTIKNLRHTLRRRLHDRVDRRAGLQRDLEAAEQRMSVALRALDLLVDDGKCLLAVAAVGFVARIGERGSERPRILRIDFLECDAGVVLAPRDVRNQPAMIPQEELRPLCLLRHIKLS
jgi:hypothetical protein